MADPWTTRAWTPEERHALVGLGPAWRLARKATGAVACPTCGAAVWTRCPDGLHPDRLFAYAANLRASTIAPPNRGTVDDHLLAGVEADVRVLGLGLNDGLSRQYIADDAAFDLAIHHGLLRLEVSCKALRPTDRWVLSDYGAACWCVA